jgi:hypothetical protein
LKSTNFVKDITILNTLKIHVSIWPYPASIFSNHHHLNNKRYFVDFMIDIQRFTFVLKVPQPRVYFMGSIRSKRWFNIRRISWILPSNELFLSVFYELIIFNSNIFLETIRTMPYFDMYTRIDYLFFFSWSKKQNTRFQNKVCCFFSHSINLIDFFFKEYHIYIKQKQTEKLCLIFIHSIYKSRVMIFKETTFNIFRTSTLHFDQQILNNNNKKSTSSLASFVCSYMRYSRLYQYNLRINNFAKFATFNKNINHWASIWVGMSVLSSSSTRIRILENRGCGCELLLQRPTSHPPRVSQRGVYYSLDEIWQKSTPTIKFIFHNFSIYHLILLRKNIV